MARYTGPACRQSPPRGHQRSSASAAETPRPRPPPLPAGRARPRPRRARAEYLLQLREKQKARRYYGLLEKQFRTLYEKATRTQGRHRREPAAHARDAASTTSSTALGFAGSRAPGPSVRRPRPLPGQRQAGRHPQLSGPTSTTSSSMRPGAPTWSRSSRRPTSLDRRPRWLQADHDGFTGKVLRCPERDEIDAPVREQLIVELYSK